jgi:hypothetical protein
VTCPNAFCRLYAYLFFVIFFFVRRWLSQRQLNGFQAHHAGYGSIVIVSSAWFLLDDDGSCRSETFHQRLPGRLNRWTSESSRSQTIRDVDSRPHDEKFSAG